MHALGGGPVSGRCRFVTICNRQGLAAARRLEKSAKSRLNRPPGKTASVSDMTFVVARNIAAALLLAGLSLVGLSSVALAVGVADAPTALDGTAILPDPSLNKGHVLPASVATAGVAVVSGAQDGPLANCSRRNPCAVPTPARDQIAVPAQGKAARRHPDGSGAGAAKPHAPAGGAADLRS